MKPEEIKESMVDSDTIITMLEEHRELYLTIRAEDVKAVKQRLSQAKFKRGTEERMRMIAGETYRFHIPTKPANGEEPRSFLVVDLHLLLGDGADIFVLRCNAADDTL